MFGLLGLVAILISAVFAFFAPLIFNIPVALIADTRIVLAVGGMTMAVTLIGAVFGGVIAGLERFDVSSGIEIVVTGLRTVAIVLALNDGYGLVTLALIHLVSSCVNGVMTWLAAVKLYPQLKVQFVAPLKPHMRTILSFSLFLSAIHVFSTVIYYTDSLVIALFLPVSSVTFFAIAGNLCDYARQVASAVSMLMTPRVSAMTSSGSAMVSTEILRGARIATLITAPIAITFFFRGESFINLWMGREYGATSGQILNMLSLVVVLSGARNVATSAIIGVNKHRTLLPIFGFEAVCNLVLSAMLVQTLGLIGVAIGTMIPSLISSLGLLPRCLSKATGVPQRHFYSRGWLLPILACIPFAISMALIEHYFPAGNIAIFFAQVAVSAPLILVGALLICLSPPEKEQVLLALRKGAARLTKRPKA